MKLRSLKKSIRFFILSPLKGIKHLIQWFQRRRLPPSHPEWYLSKNKNYYNPTLEATVYQHKKGWAIARSGRHYLGYSSKHDAQKSAFKMWLQEQNKLEAMPETKSPPDSPPKKTNKDEVLNILTAWTALEVLSPQSFLKPEDLAKGDPALIASFKDTYLPWEKGGEKAPPHTQLVYHIVLGTIDLRKAVQALIEKYGDKGHELPSGAGEAIIGVLTVNHKGVPLRSPLTNNIAVGISSFAWGVSQALQGGLQELGSWPLIEKEVEKALESFFHKDAPLDKITLDKISTYLVETFHIPSPLLLNKKFAVRTYQSLKRGEPPQPLLLNSFYLKDLAWAHSLVKTGKAPENLLTYLGALPPSKRHTVLDNPPILEKLLAPQHIPSARWPGPGRHPLVLLQQAAVNSVLAELKQSGILAVNGPPGTGKTTLLRDIVAGIVSRRAEILSKFEDPAEAFIPSEDKVHIGNSWLQVHRLDDRLKGFEILIASSNNKAVENVSAELPNLKAIASDAQDLRYFSTLSDGLLGGNTWGLISAVLGNASNRHRFCQKFWWDNDVGFLTYLIQAAGMPQMIDIKDPETGKITGTKCPKIIQENDPPHNHREALRRWQQVRKRFEQVLKASQSKLKELENIRQDIHTLESLESTLNIRKSWKEHIEEHEKLEPAFFKKLLLFPSARKWKKDKAKLSQGYDLRKKVDGFAEKLGSHLIDNNFFLKTHAEVNQTSPWCDAKIQALRDEVFIESLKLCKAFIDAAAKPLRHNLGILMQTFSKPTLFSKEESPAFLADLWSSFFLVVPSVSTTFASMDRMFPGLPPNALGWLLIDEAGQALPQAAVGALLRTKRCVVTGDPLQIEPVVVLPDTLTEKICTQFEVDPERFNAPKASVQTLADAVSPYFGEFNTKYGSRTVGFPLLVHRRCADPMFSISNAVAYERLMVQAKSPYSSPIRACLGQSTWFHVQGKAQDKWCPEEGELVLQLLSKLKNASVFPDVYIVTPFNAVAYHLRKTIIGSGILNSWLPTNPHQWIKERIGTVHTAQGREAEGVILVLGAPAPDEKGSRVWAGLNPNLLNVAVTRAKEVMYVVGNQELWKEAGVFKELYHRIAHSPIEL